MSGDDRDDTWREFRQVVNMTPGALHKWLASDQSRPVGMVRGGEKATSVSQPEAVGHHMGERILEIESRKAADHSDQDYHDMRKVIGYVHRHLAQRTSGDVSDTRWRKSLMNWGHDPLK